MARTLFILNDPPCGSERSYNALRLATALAKREGEEVRLFLLGDAASGAKAHQKVPQGYYSVERMIHGLAAHGVDLSVCGSCMDARGIDETELAEGARRGTMEQLAAWTLWADEALVF